MRRTKPLLILLASALVVAALAAPGSASAATQICPSNMSNCTSPYVDGTEFTATGFANLGVTSCSASTFKFKLISTVGGVRQAKILSFSATGCSGGCTVSALGLGWEMPIEVGSVPHGSAKIVNPKFEVNCGIPCTYTAASLPEFITGGSPATFKSSGGTLTSSDPGCSKSINVSMVHEVPGATKGSGFYVTN